MSAQLLLAPSAVFQIPPPYDRYEAVPDLSVLTPQDLPDAALLAIGLDPPRHAWGEAAALVPQLRARFPAAPVVLRVAPGADADDLEQARRAGELHVRAVVVEGEPLRAQLRKTLTNVTGMPDEVEQWLPIRLPSVAPGVGQMIGLIVRRAGVPGPGKWLAAAHAVHAALRLQADESLPLLTIAVECGYSDHSSLSRQSLRLFGVRPGAIRRTLGWEWLLDRWLRRMSA